MHATPSTLSEPTKLFATVEIEVSSAPVKTQKSKSSCVSYQRLLKSIENPANLLYFETIFKNSGPDPADAYYLMWVVLLY